jgi:hypothetical protein
VDHEPGHQTVGLDTKKKSIGATERNEEERAVWRENASKRAARKIWSFLMKPALISL